MHGSLNSLDLSNYKSVGVFFYILCGENFTF